MSDTIRTIPEPRDTPVEPSILTASVYFWKGRGNASSRRRSEEQRISEVACWFRALGMDTEEFSSGCRGTLGAIVAEFQYSESCANVYRHLCVKVAGQRSNLTTLRKLADPKKRQGTLSAATRRANKQQVAAVTNRLQGA